MKVVLAPDSFKESMTASHAAAAMARGVRRVWPLAECISAPMADGGEGTLAVLAGALGAELHRVETTDAYGRAVTASFGLTRLGTAIIEAATVVGLDLVPPHLRQIEHASSFGLAALLRAALDAGATRLIVGIGGTATSDGGAGVLAGLGVRLLDAAGDEIVPDPTGLEALATADLSGLEPRLASVRIDLACDVTNPLLGTNGAVAVFAPQKGARPEQLPGLEACVERLAQALMAAGLPDICDRPGAGAGGGLGAAMLALGGCRRSGFELIAEAVSLDQLIADTDLVLTGEGRMDAQTGAGKAPSGVLELATRHRVPVIAFAGQIADPAAVAALGFAAVVVINGESIHLAEALARGPELLEEAVAATLVRWPTARIADQSAPGQ